ncbi:MAG TPA: SCP2 sterol-binding domain-containing protein [Acidimicrobiales bacterium]|nr:SCP2 sterol-binding domain-containing protein [Acidimicrobiales bacterium]
MATHPFLSEPWLVEARAIRSEYDGKTAPIGHSVRMNLVITGVPFDSGTLDAHLDTSSGELLLDVGHIEPTDLAVTLDYEIAKAILIEGNPQVGMQAFMAGKIKVEGDMAKLLALQGGVSDPSTAEVAARIKAITE